MKAPLATEGKIKDAIGLREELLRDALVGGPREGVEDQHGVVQLGRVTPHRNTPARSVVSWQVMSLEQARERMKLSSALRGPF